MFYIEAIDLLGVNFCEGYSICVEIFFLIWMSSCFSAICEKGYSFSTEFPLSEMN